MWSRRARLRLAVAVAVALALAAGRRAWAQEPPDPPARPRFTLAIGMGATFDPAGFAPARTEAVPSFFAVGGVGDDWTVGLELAAFASTASGRFRAPDAPVDRLALDGLGVLRPFVRRFDVLDSRYAARVARTLALEGGVGLERDSRGVRSGSRVGVHTGGRIEFPLTPAGPGSQLRVRLAARRLVGLYRPRVGDLEVGDSTELYLALATVF